MARLGSRQRLLGLLAAAAALATAPVAHAGWDPARATGQPFTPFAAAAPGGAFTLWGTGPGARRLTLPATTSTPLGFSSLPYGPWLANRRGDALLVDGIRREGVLLIEAGGARVPASMELAGAFASEITAALGEDGAVVVAWFTEREVAGDLQTAVWARVRPAGGAFGPVRLLAGDGLFGEVSADVAPDGTAEVVHTIATDGPGGSLVYTLVHTSIARDGVAGPPTTLETSTEPLFDIDVVAGPPGTGRVIFGAGNASEGTVLTRTGPAAWGARQTLGEGAAGTVHRLADGGIVLASTGGRQVRVWRAAPGAQFGPPQRIARAPSGLIPDDVTVSSTAAGAVLIAWLETDVTCERNKCFDRVLAAAAGPAAPFGPPQLVSPLGTLTDRVVAALADDGRRMVAWQGDPNDAFAAATLAVAFGDATADRRLAADRRRPRVRVLSSAVRGGKLRLRLRSDEPVGVRLFVSEMPSGRALVLPARRAKTLVWSLSRNQRREWRRSVRIVFSDAAGNSGGSGP